MPFQQNYRNNSPQTLLELSPIMIFHYSHMSYWIIKLLLKMEAAVIHQDLMGTQKLVLMPSTVSQMHSQALDA